MHRMLLQGEVVSDMVIESLKVLLFGMIGVFVTMGIIMSALFILNKLGEKEDKTGKAAVQTPDQMLDLHSAGETKDGGASANRRRTRR